MKPTIDECLLKLKEINQDISLIDSQLKDNKHQLRYGKYIDLNQIVTKEDYINVKNLFKKDISSEQISNAVKINVATIDLVRSSNDLTQEYDFIIKALSNYYKEVI